MLIQLITISFAFVVVNAFEAQGLAVLLYVFSVAVASNPLVVWMSM